MAERFKETEIDEFKECFSLYDGDNDGFIGKDELELVMRSLGEPVTYLELEKIMKDSGKEKLRFPEFLKIMAEQKARSVNTRQEILAAFQACDLRKTGTVTKKELRKIMVNTGERIGKQEFDQMLHDFHLDRSSSICYTDLVCALTEVN
ncbi:calmodulin [Nematostella vectensis]|uniref:calmodulin n=1 Tax=Nematostella vectensis TaxID=45351 RepID=UPI0020777E17|nr:calmodulin [Nematostella vectensis]